MGAVTDYTRLPVPTEILALADPDSTIRKRLPSGRILEIPVVHEADASITPSKALAILIAQAEIR